MEKIKKFLEIGSGYGSGSGSGYGDGSGSGYGDGYGDGISSFDGKKVYLIDDVQTIITSVVLNMAKGFILNDDLTLTPCYIAKGNNLFAHGKTAQKANEALQEKIFANLDTDTAIEMFIETFKEEKQYSAKDFWIWHNRLTGSCEMGRNKFAKEHNIDIEKDMLTVSEFISLTKNSFGGEIIKRLEEALKGIKE